MVLLELVRLIPLQVQSSQVRAPFFIHDTKKRESPRLGTPINYAGDFRETIDNLADFESAGVQRISVPEAYSFDAVSQLGYLSLIHI